MNSVDKKYVILGSLCALVLMLAVGYAAFNAVLNIKGTTNISSSWDVKITNVTEKNKVGSATTKNKSEGQDKTLCKNELCNPTWNGLTASFEVDLVAPGDSIEYEITVSNEGDLNAKLDNIVVSDPDNEYITFETSGLAINDTLDKKTSKTLTVKVTYKDVIINNSKPSSSNLTVTLDFSQADKTTEPVEPVIPETQIVYSRSFKTVKIGDDVQSISNIITSSIYGSYLKHFIVDGKVSETEVCLDALCLKPNDFDGAKAKLSGYENCTIQGSGIGCIEIGANAAWGISDSGRVYVESNGDHDCSVDSNGEAICFVNDNVPL